MAPRLISGWRKSLLWVAATVGALIIVATMAWQFGVLNGPVLWIAGRTLGYSISCQKLSGSLLGSFTCTDFELADETGQFLTAKQLSLAWNPWSLLGGEVAVKRVGLIDGNLSRLPQSSSSSTSKGFLPSTKISIDHLDVRGFVLAMDGRRRACLNLDGRSEIGPQGFDAALVLARCASGNGQLRFSGRYDKASGRLTLSAQGHDDGALASALTGIKHAGATRLVLNGSGTLAAFNGNFGLQAEGIGRVDAVFHARDLTATDLNASFQLAPSLRPAWAPQGPASLTADLARGRDGSFTIRSSAFHWDDLTGELRLAITNTGALDGMASLGATKPLVVGGTSIGTVGVHIRIDGTTVAPHLSGTAMLSKIVASNTKVAAVQSEFTLEQSASGTTTLALAGQIRGATLPAPAGDLLGSSFGFRGRAGRTRSGAFSFDGTIDGVAANLAAKAQVAEKGGSGTVTLTIANLAKAQPGLSGKMTADLKLTRLTLGGAMDGSLLVRGAEIAPSGLGAVLGKAPIARADLHAAKGNYVISDLRIDTAAFAVRGALNIASTGALAGQLHTIRGALAPLSAIAGRPLAGAFALNATVKGTRAAPTVSLAVDAPGITVDHSAVQGASLQFDARKQTQWKGHLTARAMTSAGGVDLVADLETVPGGWHARLAKGNLGSVVLAGDVKKGAQGYIGHLRMSGNVLSPVGFYLGTPMSGRGTLSFTGNGEHLHLNADLRHVVAGPLKDGTVRGDITRQRRGGPLLASLSAKDDANHAEASAVAQLTPLTVTLRKLDGAWSGAHFALASPATFTAADGKFSLKRMAVGISGGELVLAANGDNAALAASLHLSNVPLAPIAAGLQLGRAQGKIDGDLVADMAPTSTQARLHVSVQGLAFAGQGKSAKPANVSFESQWDGTILTADGRITGLGSNDATLHARLPVVRTAGSYVPRLAASGPVTAQLRAQLQADRLMALLPISEETMSGTLAASVDVDGDIASPKFTGRVALTGGTFTDYETGTKLAKLNASIDASAGNKAIVKLSATDGNSGKVTADGEFKLPAIETGNIGHLSGHLDVQLADAEIVRDDLVRASTTGSIAVNLPGDQPPKISGKLRTNTVRMDLGAAIPPEIPQIEVTNINGGPPTVSASKASPSLFSRAALDIAITMPNRIYVTGRGIDAEWSGNLKVAGTVAAPDLSGQFSLVRGQADLVGKTFTLQEGRVTLDQAVAGGATVHVVAQNTESDLTVTVTADGPASDPTITWTSSPALPKSEILSRLFFGTSTPHLTAGQAFQLAELSGQLNRFGLGGGGGGLMSFARRLTGLDVFRVTAPSDLSGTGASVTAGKYITDNVYVGVQQGASASAGTAHVDVKVTPHISIDAEAGANSQGSLGATWKWDY